MKHTPKFSTLSELRSLFDVFFIDQFGVLRDGERAYDGAVAGLAELKRSQAKIVILSNSGRSGEYNATRLAALGFKRDDYDHFVTSGDVAVWLIETGQLKIASGGETRCLTISSGDDRNLADRLGWTSVSDATEADVVVISGSETETISISDYRNMLRPAAERNLPCICTNPDMEKLSGGAVLPSAGAIADLYEALGGRVERVGKPGLHIYAYAHELIGKPDRSQIVCIGDSLAHDIAGATGFGVASALTFTGISFSLKDRPGALLLPDNGPQPNYFLEKF